MNLILTLSNPELLPDSYRTRSVEFDESGGTIGRSDSCDWMLDDPDRFVSSRHVKISKRRGDFTVEDTSTNGTFLNDKLIGKGKRSPLKTGDVLRIGRFIIAVEAVGDDGKVVGAVKTEPRASLLDTQSGSDPVVLDREAGDELLRDDGDTDSIDGFLEGAPTAPLDGDLETFTGSSDETFLQPGVDDVLPDLMQSESGAAIPEDWNAASGRDAFEAAALGDGLVDTGADALFDAPPLDVPASPDAFELDPVEADPLVADAPVDSYQLEPDPDFDPAFELQPEPDARRDEVPEYVQRQASAPVLDPPSAARIRPTAPTAHAPDLDPAAAGSFAAAFIQVLGLPEEAATPEYGALMGKVMRELLDGTIDLINARSDMRNELRLRGTMVGARENNPLKFSINAQDAAARLGKGEAMGFKEATEATEEVMQDLRTHQLAMLAGIQAGIESVLKELDPKKASTSKGVLGLPGTLSRLQERHAAVTESTVERTGGPFWRAFATAYQSSTATPRR